MTPRVLCLILGTAACAAQQAPLPVYRAVRTLDPIRIDGKLEEFSWAVAPRVGSFRHIRRPEERPRLSTEAALLWDAENLYAAFACRDGEPWSRLEQRDQHLWEEEVVEVFLDPDGDGQNYAELEVNPRNVVVDLLIARPRSDLPTALRWDISGLKTAVTRMAGGWVVEIAIPWKSLAAAGVAGPPAPGARWRVGLYRIERPGGPAKADQIARLAAEVKSAPEARRAEIEERLRQLRSDDQFLAWSVTRAERGFHDPERFGIVEFAEEP